MMWRPINTVPKDGTSVLLCNAIDADGRPIDWTDDMNTAQVFVQVAAWWEGEGGWVVYCSMIRDPKLHFEPTHWMPLPMPPSPQKAPERLSPPPDKDQPPEAPKSFLNALEGVLNSYSREKGSFTPDFVLAEYLMACLTAYDTAVNRRGVSASVKQHFVRYTGKTKP